MMQKWPECADIGEVTMGSEITRTDRPRCMRARMQIAGMQIAGMQIRVPGIRASEIRNVMIAREPAAMRAGPWSAVRKPSGVPSMRVETAGKIWPAYMTDSRRGSKMSEVWPAAAADMNMRRKMRAAAHMRCKVRAAADARRKMRRAATTNMRREMGTTAAADMRNAAAWMRAAAATWMRTTAAAWMAAGTRPVSSLSVSHARRQRCQQCRRADDTRNLPRAHINVSYGSDRQRLK
jgi:hypothetical protein